MKIPKIKTTLIFLLMNEWTISKTTEKYYVLTPSKKFIFDEPYYLKLPRYEGGIDFPPYMLHIVDSIASFHQYDQAELRELLSTAIEDIQKEVNHIPQISRAKTLIVFEANRLKTTTTATP